jgi:hypothetical protein
MISYFLIYLAGVISGLGLVAVAAYYLLWKVPQ